MTLSNSIVWCSCNDLHEPHKCSVSPKSSKYSACNSCKSCFLHNRCSSWRKLRSNIGFQCNISSLYSNCSNCYLGDNIWNISQHNRCSFERLQVCSSNSRWTSHNNTGFQYNISLNSKDNCSNCCLVRSNWSISLYNRCSFEHLQMHSSNFCWCSCNNTCLHCNIFCSHV